MTHEQQYEVRLLNGIKQCEEWFIEVEGQRLRHREDGPAFIKYEKDGAVNLIVHQMNNMPKVSDDPYAIMYKNGEIVLTLTRNIVNGDDVTITTLYKDGLPYRVSYTLTDKKHYGIYGEKHRVDGPAQIVYKDGQKVEETYYSHGNVHRDNGPAKIFYKDSKVQREVYCVDGCMHREDGPADISYYKSGVIKYKGLWLNGKYNSTCQSEFFYHPNGELYTDADLCASVKYTFEGEPIEYVCPTRMPVGEWFDSY